MNINKKILNFLAELPEGFLTKKRTMFGKNMVLITPTNIKTKWCAESEMFRSCLFDENTGKIYSLGLKKFTNWGENPEFQPWDYSWKFDARHKIDGSLLCISKIDGNVLMRTRGVFDAREHETSEELDGFIEKYPFLYDNEFINSENYTILCEHTTPKRIIVLRESDEPKLTLLGIICHKTGQYISQSYLDIIAEEWNVERPKSYHYNTIEECILDVDAWRGKEGVVLYSPDGQTLKKIKAAEYCELHKLATGIKTVAQVMDLFIASPRFDSEESFYKYVANTLDYEIAEKIKDDISTVVRAYCNYTYKLHRLTDVVNDLSFCETRKEQALVITNRYDDWRRAFAFKMLDNQEIDGTLEAKALHYELQEQLNNETTTSNL